MEKICKNCDYLVEWNEKTGICWGWTYAGGGEVRPAEAEVRLAGFCPLWKPDREKLKQERGEA